MSNETNYLSRQIGNIISSKTSFINTNCFHDALSLNFFYEKLFYFSALKSFIDKFKENEAITRSKMEDEDLFDIERRDDQEQNGTQHWF
jgi:hypothetical protein